MKSANVAAEGLFGGLRFEKTKKAFADCKLFKRESRRKSPDDRRGRRIQSIPDNGSCAAAWAKEARALKKRITAAALLLGLTALLSGCVLEPAENLYAVPKQPESYYNLQSAIETVMQPGASYSAPTAGENQQAVQLNDLDGDGENEALLFWKTDGETPLVLTVFGMHDGRFEAVAEARGAGNSFDQVIYAELDDRPGNEIILGRRVSENVTQILNAYSLRDGALLELFSASYSNFTIASLTASGEKGVFLLYQDADAPNGTAELYLWSDGQMVRQREAQMSAPVGAVRRILAGDMCRGTPAVFVASAYGEDSLVTDVFGFRDGSFVNFVRLDETDTGVKTVRDYYVYGCDIDRDGLMELPRLTAMRETDDPGSRDQSLIWWYNLLPDGRTQDKFLTYHDYAGGWYVSVPTRWSSSLAVHQTAESGGGKRATFLHVSNSGQTPLFSVRTLPGATTEELLADGQWQVLQQKGDTVIVGRLESGAARYGLSAEDLRGMVQLIPVDWKTGETD